MGMMNSMRENTGVVLWILVFAFGIIWVLQDTGGLDVIGTVGDTVGSVNGDPISYEEYSIQIDSRIQNYQQQTGETMPPQLVDQTRDQVFNQLIDAHLRRQVTDRLGLTVSDAEVVDMVLGDNPHPLIVNTFGDGGGNIDRTLLQSYLNNPEASADWVYIEQILRDERLRLKLDNLITNTVRISTGDVIAEHGRLNRRVDVRFVARRFSSLPDDSISYGERDLQRFYDEHRSEFEREKAYSLSFVTLSKNPTPADTAAVINDLNLVRESFESTEEDSLFLIRNGSELPYTDAFFRRDELDAAIADAVFESAGSGEVVGPIITGGQAHLVKLLETRPAEEVAVRASHILFRAAESNEEAREAAREDAEALLRRIRSGENFAELADEHSQDVATSPGGDLGWFGPGRMVDPFEDAAFGARIGQVVGPVSTQFGYHLITVTDRADTEARIADFALSIRPSVATLSRVQEELDDLLYYAEDTGDFNAEASRRNLDVRTVQVESGQNFIPGIGISMSLMSFLEAAEVGDLSPVIELNDDFLVARVDEVIPEGFRSFEEVRVQIEPRLRNELKAEILAERMRAALAGGFDGLAAAIGTAEQTAENLSFSNMVVTGIGRDPKFVGTAMGLEEGETSDVAVGANAVYVIHVVSSTEPSPLTDTERDEIASRLLSQRQAAVRSQWISALHESADIIDNRRMFLQ